MIKRLIISLLFSILLIASMAQALPLLLAAPYVAPLVVQSVGRSAVVNLGVAANDAIWASSLSNWISSGIAIGYALISLSTDRYAEIQLKTGVPLTQAASDTGYSWGVVTAPSGWYGREDQQVLRGVASSQLDALEVARSRISLHYGTSCTLSAEGGGFVTVDANTDKAYVLCYAPGWAATIPVEVHFSKSALPVEQMDNVQRVVYVDGSFRLDSSDPDNNRGPMPLTTWDMKNSVQWNQPQSSDPEGEYDSVVQIAATPAGVAVRALSSNDGAVWDVRTFKTDAARIPSEFTQTSISYDPGLLPDIQTFVGGQSVTNPGTTPSIQFPSDYARQGEAAASTQPIIDRLSNTHEQGDPVLPTGEQFSESFFKDTFGGLLGWRLPSHASTCPTPGFNYNGQAFVMNAHCQLIADHWSALQAVMTVVWVMLALFLVLRA